MGNKVRVVAPMDPPYAESCFPLLNGWAGRSIADSPCPRPGLEIEMLHYLLTGFLQCDVEWMKVQLYNESFQYLDSGTADMLGVTQTYAYEHIKKGWIASSVVKVGDFALFGKEIDLREAQQTQSLFDGETSFEQSFQWDVWVTVIAVTITAWLLLKLPGKGAKLMGVLGFLFLNVFLSVFSNLMAIDMVIPSKVRSLPFSSLDELGEMLLSGKCRLSVLSYYSHSTFSEVVHPSHNESYANLFREAYKINPPEKVANITAMNDYILQGTSAQHHVGIDYYSASPRHELAHCRIKKFQAPFFLNKQLFVYYHKLQWLKQPLNALIGTDSVSMLYDFLKRKYFMPTKLEQKCDYEQKRVEWSPVSLIKVFSTFFVTLVGGFSLAMVVVIGELLWSEKHHTEQPEAQATSKSPTAVETEIGLHCLLEKLEAECEIRNCAKIFQDIIDVCEKGKTHLESISDC